MGMFSWKCKGCLHELKAGEYVRFNGSVGTYDGYGRACGFDYGNASTEPPCWHVRCYNNATVEDRLNDEPSEYAPNQGFGMAALENMEGYNPEGETIFQPVIFVDHYDDSTGKMLKQQWYVVDGVLRDQHHYEALYEAATEGGITDKFYGEQPADWYKTTSDEEKNAFYQKIEEMVESHIGIKRPLTTAEWFRDFKEAKQIVDLLPSLPNPEFGYELDIYGKQGSITGLYYQYNKICSGETFDEYVAFMHGRPARNGIKSY